ncbi:carbonic anhydrase [Kordiimonas sp. SCSIO 12610]|uniref:carbonic anhydrase n=1 Tax=Kordiimonas sp. SCSIO 12610 TaxID=2829597 RepID=UPI0021098F73|nr:carbonic anhydrase family protein [Kordiimonas sp. SCSIO 12610]UTW55239.1 carbonic anhydrase family protein [Kordiimonas sp. SCSIO 12610]
MIKLIISSAITVSLIFLSTNTVAQDAWSYEGNTGPDNWGNLSPDYKLCSAGQYQSPINIEGTDPAILHDLQLNYNVHPVDLRHHGKHIVQNYSNQSVLNVGASAYELKTLTFKSPAEHTIAGNRYPLEIQLTHQNKNGEVAILSIFGATGSENLALNEIIANLPLEAGQTSKNDKVVFNARDLTPHNKAYYRYNGSLTTPPCTEGVNWYILKTPIEASPQQINMLNALSGNNARPVNTRNHRIILDTNQ